MPLSPERVPNAKRLAQLTDEQLEQELDHCREIVANPPDRLTELAYLVYIDLIEGFRVMRRCQRKRAALTAPGVR